MGGVLGDNFRTKIIDTAFVDLSLGEPVSPWITADWYGAFNQIVGLALVGDARPTIGHLSLSTPEHLAMWHGHSPQIRDLLCFVDVIDAVAIGSFGAPEFRPLSKDHRLQPTRADTLKIERVIFRSLPGLVQDVSDLPGSSLTSRGVVEKSHRCVADIMQFWRGMHSVAPNEGVCMQLWTPVLHLTLRRHWRVLAFPFNNSRNDRRFECCRSLQAGVSLDQFEPPTPFADVNLPPLLDHLQNLTDCIRRWAPHLQRAWPDDPSCSLAALEDMTVCLAVGMSDIADGSRNFFDASNH